MADAATDMAALPEADRTDPAPHPRFAHTTIGQDGPRAQLFEAFRAGRLHHAWLLCGPRGVGKATLAWEMAREVLGARDGAARARIEALSEPQLALLRRPYDPERKRFKAQITVEEVRRLRRFFGLSSMEGGWRVVIVDAAEDMNPAAANALLKLLEEPPERALFLLISHAPGRLLPTIRSRALRLPCAPLGAADLASVLAGLDVAVGAPDALAELAGGAPGEAVAMEAAGGLALYDRILQVLAKAPRFERPALLALGEAAAGRGAEVGFAMQRRLVCLALARIARAAALGRALPEAAPGEAQIFTRLALPQAAPLWAGLAQELGQSAGQAAAVNLDPAAIILDMWLQIEATARKIL